MRGSDIAAATAPSTPSVPSAPARGKISSSGYDPVAPSTQSTRTGGQNITEWQETSIMYARARKPDLSGEIFAKCTPRQRLPILKSTKYAILAKIGCPRVHFSEILPERGPSAAQAYIMLVSCRAFRLFARCLGRFSSMIRRRSQRPHPHASPRSSENRSRGSPTSAQRPSPEKQRMH